MTIEEARALIPPGWVECGVYAYNAADDGIRYNYTVGDVRDSIYAIPATKPEPRRVPMGEMVIEYNEQGLCFNAPDPEMHVRDALGFDVVANTKWRLDTDAREWVEVRE